MKNILRFLFGVLVLVTASCSSEDIEPQVPTPTTDVQSRASTAVNANLLTNWETYTNIQILGPQGVEIGVAAPWASVNNSSIDGNFAKDIKKSDGWIMLFHTFGNTKIDPNLNYMCFYNRFSGMMKFFYYAHKQDDGTLTMWDVRSNTSTPQALFSSYGYFSNALNGNTNFSNYSLMLENASIEGSTLRSGWNGFEFKASEYQQKIATSALTIGAYNTVFTDYNFEGTTNSTTTGTITTINGYTNILEQNKDTQAALSAVGGEAEKLAKDLAKKIPDTNFVGLTLRKALNSVSSGNIAGAIADGLGFIFKSLIKPETTVSKVSLTTNGTIKMGGQGQTKKVSGVSPLTFDLNSLITYNPSLSLNSNIVSLAYEQRKSINLGVWNLRSKPTIKYCRYSKVVNYEQLTDQDIRFFDVNGIIYLPETYISNVDIEFNPDIKPYITSYSVKTAMIDVVGGNRALSTNKNANFEVKTSNLIHKDASESIYGISENQTQNFRGFVFEVPDGINIDQNTELYYDWGNNATGNRAVAVIVTWTVKNGTNTQTFTESRVYDVDYTSTITPLNEGLVNNPPYTYLLQNSNFTPYLRINPIPDEKFDVGLPTLTDGRGVGLSQQ